MPRKKTLTSADQAGAELPEAKPGYPLPGAPEPLALRVYSGLRDVNGCKVFVNGKPFLPDRSQKVRNHSPAGFEWGYQGSGPAQLALAILLAECPSQDYACMFYQDFKRDVICRIQADTWTLTSDDVKAWINAHTPPLPEDRVDEFGYTG